MIPNIADTTRRNCRYCLF